MGKLEKEALSERRKDYVQAAILSTIAVTGVCALAMVAPNTLQLLKFVKSKHRFGNQVRTAAGRLAQKGLVRFVEHSGKKYVELTERGRRQIQYEQEKVALSARQKKRWDKRYRMVVFDIPEKRRAIRIRLRTTMQEVGFLRLQDSVWVYPYDCEDFIALLKADLHIGKDVLYTIVEKIENDSWIKKHFTL